MLSARYHIATIIAIFLSLGIGIVIGGTLGQKWAAQAENSIVDLLTDRYEMVLAENQWMKKQIGSLELFLKTISPSAQNKVVWWIRNPKRDDQTLAMALHAAGVHWVEKDAVDGAAWMPQAGETGPDYILVTDPVVKHQVEEQLRAMAASAYGPAREAEGEPETVPVLIDVSERMDQLTEPNKIVEFMLDMKRLVEEDACAANKDNDFRYHSCVE
jgi:hypothetical protein